MDQPTPLQLKVGTILLTLLITYWAYQLLFFPMPYIFLDYVNFVTHETGGVLFIFFNHFFFLIGQNVYQNLLPLLFFIYFLKKRATASSAFSFFWFGDNLLQTGIYMKDATVMMLPITSIWGSDDGSGSGHDWHYIFSQTHLLPYDLLIGGFFFALGAVCIIASVIYLWYLSWQRVAENGIKNLVS